MSRAVLPLAVGVLAGGAAVYFFDRLDSGTGPEPFPGGAATSGQISANELIGVRSDDSPNVDAMVGSNDDPELTRLLALAATDRDAALEALRDLAPPARQREVALALLEALGNNDATIERIAAMLPAADRLSFRVDALAARAEYDPASALYSALALDISAARRYAMPRIAAAAARVDPLSAIAQATLIGNREMKSLFLSGVAAAWAEVDGQAALAWLTTAVPAELSAEAAAVALETIAAIDPGALLASADGFSPALQATARKAAILAMAEQDTEAALTALETLAPGRDRGEIESALGEFYALSDPQAALEWARTLPDSLQALEGVIRGAAFVDYDAAVDLLMGALESESINLVYALMDSGAGDFGLLADRLLESDIPDLNQKLRQMMVRWPQVDAEAALEWALANVYDIEEGWLMRLPLDGGRDYPEIAMAALDQIPLEMRERWIAGVAAGVAQRDTDLALTFLEQHRGEPGYAAGIGGVLEVLGSSDPAAGVELIERVGQSEIGGNVMRFAAEWARKDATAAANWAAQVSDELMATSAVGNVMMFWSQSDAAAAGDWLLSLPNEVVRSRAIPPFLQVAASSTGTIDQRMLNAIDDEQARQRAALGAIIVIARNDTDEARRLIDQHLSDPVLRQQAEQRVAQGAGGTDITSIFSSQVDFPR